MNSKPLLFFLLTFAFCFYGAKAQQEVKEMCITIDDLPVVSYGITTAAHRQMIIHKLLKTFDRYSIPAIGYVNEGKMFKKKGHMDSVQYRLLKTWLSRGYDLGNHSYSHWNYHKTSFRDFSQDILRGETITKPLCLAYGKKMQYFRHPFLRVGNTKARHDSLTHFLAQNGYTEAPVTIDNEDYLFAKAYHIAFTKEDKPMMLRIGQDYIAYMEAKLNYFEKMGEDLFHRKIKQTLLLHASLLNADYLDDLAEVYRAHGYRFVTQGAVLEDEAYRSPIVKYKDWGISWLERWAMTMGKKGDFFKEDPITPQYIRTAAQQ